MHRNKSVNTHQFAMVPKAEIPRSQFNRQFTHKTAFDAGYLVPIYVDEVLPGDTFNMRATIFARMATPLYPIMDNLYMDTFFFFVPNRLIWDNWKRFMGEQDNPDDSISFEVPHTDSPAGGYAIGSLQDYMGLPTVGQVGAQATVEHSTLWTRAYNLIWNTHFRDSNLQDSVVVDKGDTDDDPADYVLLRRGKRHDYFTSGLPWAQKGGTAISLPLGTSAPVLPLVADSTAPEFWVAAGAQKLQVSQANATLPGVTFFNYQNSGTGSDDVVWHDPGLYADLTAATAATINQLRTSFQIQKLLERDARGGTRYPELIKAHFGVVSPDFRQQRPEYLGGGSTPININPVAQTSGSGLTGQTTPLGNLGAFGTSLANGHGFTASFTEHGVIIGLASVRADLTYQQGLHKMWSRKTRYDFYFPAFATLGEQAILSKEIFCDGSNDDDNVFAYQERWAEYRYKPSQITSLFRSTAASNIDGWHLAQEFASRPELNEDFIMENPPMERVLAVGAAAAGQHFIVDAFFDNKVARPMPLYSVPGLIDHF